MPRGLFENLEFDLPTALLRELTGLLDQMQAGPLNLTTVNQHIPEEQGVYQLFLDDRLVYVGKTDAEAGLNRRLGRHTKKIQQRQGLNPARVSFKAVRVYVFTAMDLEQQLIKHYQSNGASLIWNMSGFGANDPGRERDTTLLKDEHYDVLYPIDIDTPVNIGATGLVTSVSDVLARLKTLLPFTVRYQGAGARSRQPHPDLVAATVSLTASPDTVRNILLQIKAVLPLDWQITALPGYIIAYKETKTYPRGVVI